MQPYRTILTRAIAACVVLFFSTPVSAADFVITVTGPYQGSFSESYRFDGTRSLLNDLPSLFNEARLDGGSFTANYIFPTVTPPPSGTNVTFSFGPTYGLTDYALFDSAGAVVHQGSNPLDPGARVWNNQEGFFPGDPADLVDLACFVNDVTGLITPLPLYSPTPDVFATRSGPIFFGPVAGGTDYLTNLAIPLDAATYLSFPERRFSTGMIFGDGDYWDQIDPYQYVKSSVSYGITKVTVTAVSEPGLTTLVLSIAVTLGMVEGTRRRRIRTADHPVQHADRTGN